MRLVICNCPPESAEDIAKEVMKVGLAAAVSAVEGVTRHFRDGDNVRSQKDSLLFIHTVEERFQELAELVAKMQPGSMPEIITLEIFEGEGNYIDWAEEHLKKVEPKETKKGSKKKKK